MAKVGSGLHAPTYEMPEEFQFPLDSDGKLERFEEWLRNPLNERMKTDLATSLSSVGGVETKRVVWNILARMITCTVARRINWKGVNGKRAFTKMAMKIVLFRTAKYRNGSLAEDVVTLTVTVLDQNDNPPYFEPQHGYIPEFCKKGSVVMQIEGKDKDEPGNINSEIAYSIVSQEPEGTGHMFAIDSKTGQLYVKEETLDRETIDFYKLVVRLLDINDNIPTLEKSEYDGEVEENVADVVVMRIKALDKDLPYSENWLTVFTIAKGNEDNLFSIETDKETNEGVLKLIKPVDFEELQNLELGLIVENVAPFVDGGPILMDVDVQIGEGVKPGTKPKPSAPAKSYPIKIAVKNDPEGPKFRPKTKNVPTQGYQLKTSLMLKAQIQRTGLPSMKKQLRLNSAKNRIESPFVVNGTYIATVLVITNDMPSKTATGTIAIQVLDSNDHCPTLTTTHSTQCTDETTVYVTAFDEDANPNGAAFTFRVIPDGTRGSWDVEVVNETSATLHSRDPLWPGLYEVQVEVLDAQGLSSPTNDIFTVDVCTCVETNDCRLKSSVEEEGTSSTELSAPAIGLLLTAMCLFLFIPLLMLFCQCGAELFPDSFRDMPWETKEQLIAELSGHQAKWDGVRQYQQVFKRMVQPC
ncbi:Desmoglein-2 [Dissostichus eleginoides]|uniref:Desmoglein-2 n=1 Tax=Dissostichus eleginoides TaxID=100907 RepID=A0AAD9FF97_DISEL|nr:Desmoglein-2 [Dissostichus eleginoides]